MPDIRHHAMNWVERGYFPVPIPFREKGPKLEGWQNLHLNSELIPNYFNGQPQNIGVLLGEPYGNCDIDLDSAEAVAAWPLFAPDTALIFGRKSKPRSHWFYRIDPPCRSVKYLDPVHDGTLLEFRCLKTDGSVGLQTMVPPSAHPSGEVVEFWRDGEPANVDAGDLGRAVRWTAAVALLKRHWPQEGGGRHDAFLALAGALAYARWELGDATALVGALYRLLWPNGADLSAAAREVESTFQRFDDGHEITGLPHLVKLVAPAVVKSVARWLALRQEPERKEKKAFAVETLPLAWDMEVGELEWAVDGLVAASSVTMISGDSGVGKSTLALQLAGCVAHGTAFLQREVKRRPVLYVDRENPLFVVKERLHRLRIPKTPDLIIWGGWNDPQPEGPDAGSIIEFCKQRKPLVIFDALIAFHRGDEQNAFETRKHMQTYRALATMGAAVVVLHNTGKSETSKQYRGSSDIKAALDSGYVLEAIDAAAGGALTTVRFVPFKTRIGPVDALHIAYENGRFETAAQRKIPDVEHLYTALRTHPNSSHRTLTRLLEGLLSRRRIIELLIEGVQQGKIEVSQGKQGGGNCYRLCVQPDLDGL